ncbi:MAG TPA: TonB-dependent siderophore receptor, partial [Achromobacter sp.]|nr:TonB-dependent siderophore receptor [Achromobacter sp.]
MKIRTLACMAATLPCLGVAYGQTSPETQPAASSGSVVSMEAIKVEASADASAGGLAAPFAGGQVAGGGRVGVLGTQDNLSTPFSITSYTNELIQDKQARSVGDVLQNDAGVRVARGFGNFQESYFIRGFI